MSTEIGWEQNRDEYLRKTYGATRSSPGPTQLTEVVDKWEMLTEDADRPFLWKSLAIFAEEGSLEAKREGERTLIDIDPEIEMEDLEELSLDFEEYRRTAQRTEEIDYLEDGDLEIPGIPGFIMHEHGKRQGGDVYMPETRDSRGVQIRSERSNGETWIGLSNNDRKGETRLWSRVKLPGIEMEDGTELFTDGHASNYLDEIWDSRMKIKDRSRYVHEAAREAVKEVLPEIKERYNENAENYGWERIEDEHEILKREFRLMSGEREYDEENPRYIEEIVDSYYEDGLERDSRIMLPLLEKMESRPLEEGDMPLEEATRGSETSEGRKRRNQTYMSHYLDQVWQMSQTG